jgi:pimeloyl-ACP methyl ester carboxylesterase
MTRDRRARGIAVAPHSVTTRTHLGDVAHTDSGSGPVLLALHGAMGGADQSWLLGQALWRDAATRRVIGVARPGYPGTALSLGETPEAQADLYAALLDSLGIDRAILAAVSAGGPSALQFALRFPQRCRGLILVSAATGTLDGDHALKRLRAMERLTRMPGLGTVLAWLAGRDPEAAARRAILDPDLLARTLEDAEAGPLLRGLGATTRSKLKDRLPGSLNDTLCFEALPPFPYELLTVPVLVLHGSADRVVPYAHAEAAAGAAQAQLVPLESGDHVALFTHLGEVREAVARFETALD